MYEINSAQTQGYGAVLGGDVKGAYLSRTIGENIDARIEALRMEIARLQGVKMQFENGSSMLNIRIEDLRLAMSY